MRGKVMTVVTLTFCLLFLMAPLALGADGKIPSLLGKWKTSSMGGMMLHSSEPGKETHWQAKQTALEAEATIETQDGRFITGFFKSKLATEKFIGMIAEDNKTVYFADLDGFFDAKLVNRDTIKIVYRHSKATDTVVAIGTWKRQK
ncbi:MAG: hypothetical protein HY910_13665 [Desulfarculus sp.]|nr:hypothetical protein [Desulfarculus sp.]